MKYLLLLTFIFIIDQNINAQIFIKITGDPLVSDDRYSEGSSWGDINNDGHLDVFVPHLHTDKKNILFINNGDGSFTQIISDPVVTDNSTSSGGSFGDYDNDGDLDIFVSNYFNNNNSLYFNDGAGGFSRITTGSIVNDQGQSFGSSIVDYDNDGFLDIHVVNGAFTTLGANNFLYHNNGDGSFTKINSSSIVNDGKHSSSSSWCDYDNDGDQDLFVANGGTYEPLQVNNIIYINNGNGTFTEIDPVTIGIDHSYSSAGSWADFDNDGDFDLFVTNFLGNNNILYKNNNDGTFVRITNGAVVNDGGDSVSSSWADFDNDGDLDLYVTNDYNENNFMYRNNGDGTFTKITQGDPVNDGGRSNGATWADYNNDGFLDLFVPNGQRPSTQSNNLYRNNPTSNNWINIRCIGNTSNKNAIGTEVRAKSLINGENIWQLRLVSGSTGFNAQNSFNVEFGFGDAAIIDSLIFEWPSGLTDVYTNVAVNKFYEANEGTGLNPVLTTIKYSPNYLDDFKLSQNYPNPFNPRTTIEYKLPVNSFVKLIIYDLLGNEVKTLVYKHQSAGSYKISWNGLNSISNKVASGIYVYELRTNYNKLKKKMILLQ